MTVTTSSTPPSPPLPSPPLPSPPLPLPLPPPGCPVLYPHCRPHGGVPVDLRDFPCRLLQLQRCLPKRPNGGEWDPGDVRGAEADGGEGVGTAGLSSLADSLPPSHLPPSLPPSSPPSPAQPTVPSGDQYQVPEPGRALRDDV